jgi:hypothetical protein
LPRLVPRRGIRPAVEQPIGGRKVAGHDGFGQFAPVPGLGHLRIHFPMTQEVAQRDNRDEREQPGQKDSLGPVREHTPQALLSQDKHREKPAE